MGSRRKTRDIEPELEFIRGEVTDLIALDLLGKPQLFYKDALTQAERLKTEIYDLKKGGNIDGIFLTEMQDLCSQLSTFRLSIYPHIRDEPSPTIVQSPNPQWNQRPSRAKIERETIPRFDGNIRKFKKFWIPFKSLVWSNPELDSAEKLRRLYANVNESVHRLLPDIDNTEIDLNQIEGDLKNEFQDEVKLQLEFRAVLAKLPEFKNCYDSHNWRQVEEVARDIKSLFPEDAVFHHTALKEIAKKLPFQEAKKLRLSARFTIDTLLEICKEFITAESRMDNPPAGETTTSNSEQRNRSRDDNRGQSYRANVDTTQPSFMCLICIGSHDTASCLISLDERRKIVTQRKGCFRCLRSYTRNHECSRIETCQMCDRAHSYLIGCGNRNERGSGAPSTRRPENGQPDPNQPDNSNNARPSERSTASQLSDEQMTTGSTMNANLVQTNVNRYTPVIQEIVDFNGRKQQARAKLDCGADVSHISLPCVQRLQAPIIDNGITQMSAFASPTGRDILKLPGSNFSLTVREAESDLPSSPILARGRLASKMSTETTPLFELKCADMASQTTSTINKHPTRKKNSKTNSQFYEYLLHEGVEANFEHPTSGRMFQNITKKCSHFNRVREHTLNLPKKGKFADPDILRQHNRLQNLLRHFRKRWKFSYLTQTTIPPPRRHSSSTGWSFPSSRGKDIGPADYHSRGQTIGAVGNPAFRRVSYNGLFRCGGGCGKFGHPSVVNGLLLLIEPRARSVPTAPNSCNMRMPTHTTGLTALVLSLPPTDLSSMPTPYHTHVPLTQVLRKAG